MRFRLLTPRWLGLHVLAVLAVIVCWAAGYWQFIRAQEPDRGEVTGPAEELAAAQPLEDVTDPGDYMPEWDGNMAVSADGVYGTDETLLAPGRNGDDELGYYVIAPLITEDGTAVVVNRGWIPTEAGEAGVPDDLPALPEGEVELTGWLQPPQKDEEGVAPFGLPDGHVGRIAPSLLINEWPYSLYEGYVVLGDQTPTDAAASAGTPMEPSPPPRPEPGTTWNWKNVSYAAQWGVFGVSVIVFWVSLMRRELEDARAEDASAADSDDQVSDDQDTGSVLKT